MVQQAMDNTQKIQVGVLEQIVSLHIIFSRRSYVQNSGNNLIE